MVDNALVRLQSLTFEGAASFLSVVDPLPLAGQGRVLIMGAEGSGKTTIPEVMTLILYGKGAPRFRATGLVESTIVNQATGYQGTLDFISGRGTTERHVSITQAFRHKRLNSRYIISIDGMREEPDTKPEQKKLVKRLAPLSYEEWLGVVYLHQGGIHDLLAGTPTEKRKYLTSVFGLDFYDDLINEAKEELRRLTQAAAGAPTLQQKMVDLEGEAEEQEAILSSVPGGISEVEEGIDKLSKKLQKWASDLATLEAAKVAAAKLDAVDAKVAVLAKATATAGREEVEVALKQAQDERAVIAGIIADNEALVRADKAKAKAFNQARVDHAAAQGELKAAKEKQAFLVSALEGMYSFEALTDARDLVGTAISLLGDDITLDLEKDVVDIDDWQAAAREATSHLRTAAKLTKLAQQGCSTCPTCDRDLEAKSLKLAVKKLRERGQADIELAIGGVINALSLLLGEWRPSVKDGTAQAMQRALTAAVQTAGKMEGADQEVVRAREAAKKAKDRLASTPEPEKAEKLAEALRDQREQAQAADAFITDLNRLLSLYDQREALEGTVEHIDVENLDERIDSLSDRREKTEQRYRKAMAIKTRHDQASATLRAITKQIVDIQDRIEEHADNALKIQHYELTLMPYFETLRAAKVNASVSVLEGVLPVYVSAMSSSQYLGAEVKLSISDDLKKVDLMLRAGSRSSWTSAIQSSGGQRRRFTLAIIAALREVSPRRANLMFFDEPFADLESEGKMLFLDRLVPTLMDRCDDLDSIFVIAHDREILEASNDSFDSVWQAERLPNGSRITTDQKLSLVEGR